MSYHVVITENAKANLRSYYLRDSDPQLLTALGEFPVFVGRLSRSRSAPAASGAGSWLAGRARLRLTATAAPFKIGGTFAVRGVAGLV